jgi:hypothetical protein
VAVLQRATFLCRHWAVRGYSDARNESTVLTAAPMCCIS